MTLFDLYNELINAKVPSNMYSLDGGLPSERHCITKQNGSNNWEVYYSERGNKSSLKIFSSEDEACKYFYNWVIKVAKSMGLI